jgi:2-deoxy-D-gluconate 3-dehydrogenase
MSHRSIHEIYDLNNKTAIVTGGAMGIGFGIVKRLLEAGANVVIADMNEQIGSQKAKELGEKTVFIKTDVSSEQDVKNLISQTLAQFGSIDILVNNAGIYPQKKVLEMDVAFWDKIQAVNERSVFLCCREAAKVMMEMGVKGSIINIGSIDSLHPSMVGLAAYDTSKHGVWGFSKNFALEVANSGIRINVIAPGGIATEGVAASMGGSDQMKASVGEFASRVPLGRMGEPDDIATAALFLASDASSYMTGSIMVVDGGVLLK